MANLGRKIHHETGSEQQGNQFNPVRQKYRYKNPETALPVSPNNRLVITETRRTKEDSHGLQYRGDYPLSFSSSIQIIMSNYFVESVQDTDEL